MTVTAVPIVTIAGEAIPAGKVGGVQPAVVAVGSLKVTWGRKTLLTHPTPATASVTVLDTTPTGTYARRTDLKGKVVLISWSTGTSSGTSFRGRVTDVEAVPRAGRRGFLVTITASSKEVDAANWTAPEGTTWPAETALARLNRIKALMPSTLFAGGIELPNRAAVGLVDVVDPTLDFDGYPVGAGDVGGRDCLSLLRVLWQSLAPVPLVYDPAADSLSFIRSRIRQNYQPAGGSIVGRLVLIDGKWRTTPITSLGTSIDAALVPLAGPLAQPLESMLTRVHVKWWNPATQKEAEGGAFIGGAPAETEAGRRALSVESIIANIDLATQLVAQWVALAAQVGEPNLTDPITYRSSKVGGFLDDTAAAILLAGRERPAEVFIGGSWVTRLGKRPLFGIIGGSIGYKAGEWELQLQPAPVRVDNPTAKPVTANSSANSAAIKLRDIHDSVTVGDLEYVHIGAGYTIDTQPWGF